VKAAAKAAGAYGCTISGAGPTCVAVVANAQVITTLLFLVYSHWAPWFSLLLLRRLVPIECTAYGGTHQQ
jgi:homoserine kinase